jgi:oligopeptide/dipeptide ABC transporter ATP-binding protein
MLITHDLGVVADFCDRVQVMYAGRIVERAGLKEAFTDPLHPYTRGLLASSPRLDVVRTRLDAIQGDPPAHAGAVAGCPFHPRCPEAMDICAATEPELLQWGAERRWVACWKRQEEA